MASEEAAAAAGGKRKREEEDWFDLANYKHVVTGGQRFCKLLIERNNLSFAEFVRAASALPDVVKVLCGRHHYLVLVAHDRPSAVVRAICPSGIPPRHVVLGCRLVDPHRWTFRTGRGEYKVAAEKTTPYDTRVYAGLYGGGNACKLHLVVDVDDDDSEDHYAGLLKIKEHPHVLMVKYEGPHVLAVLSHPDSVGDVLDALDDGCIVVKSNELRFVGEFDVRVMEE